MTNSCVILRSTSVEVLCAQWYKKIDTRFDSHLELDQLKQSDLKYRIIIYVGDNKTKQVKRREAHFVESGIKTYHNVRKFIDTLMRQVTNSLVHNY